MVHTRRRLSPKLEVLNPWPVIRHATFAPSSCPAWSRVLSAAIRLIGAVLLEANDEWQLQNRYMQTEPMAELMPPLIDAVPSQFPP